ncbi:hypothetical protein HU200_033778 [Digitaria exilis]|uniref:Glycosyltransferase n=1 Tax=Digitaria exilis TaxID=1010633 RepID=A0A835BR52_9POAL|nr:hypothetical protein HU200_033778 [Digitaria exilis]
MGGGGDDSEPKASTGGGSHVLLLPYPSQGHVHPMLQFGKRLAFHGLRPTLAVTRFILTTCAPDAAAASVRLAAVSDGFDRGGFGECGDVTAYLSRLEAVGSETLAELLRDEAARGRPVRAVVHDAFLPWARGVARTHGAAAAAFFTQPCAVNVAYGHVWCRRLGVPVDATARLPGLPALEPEGLPWFLRVGPGPYPAYFELVVRQFQGLEEADDVLVNSFYELEPEVSCMWRHACSSLSWAPVPRRHFALTLRFGHSQESEYMASAWRAKTIGPTVPASYLGDDRLPSDTKYGLHLFELTTAPCIAWLDAHPPRSVVYVSFGSLSDLDSVEMREVAHGLLDAGRPFLWVVRASEAHKLPAGYEDAAACGLVVSWCPQLEVLAHRAVGCFVTHCGWNSTVEAVVAGVPMVAVPQWTDQPMNARYVEAAWRVGVRVRPAAADGLVRRGEVASGIGEVMDGERSGEYRRNAAAWREKARAASREGGSSDRNIADFSNASRAAASPGSCIALRLRGRFPVRLGVAPRPSLTPSPVSAVASLQHLSVGPSPSTLSIPSVEIEKVSGIPMQAIGMQPCSSPSAAAPQGCSLQALDSRAQLLRRRRVAALQELGRASSFPVPSNSGEPSFFGRLARKQASPCRGRTSRDRDRHGGTTCWRRSSSEQTATWR